MASSRSNNLRFLQLIVVTTVFGYILRVPDAPHLGFRCAGDGFGLIPGCLGSNSGSAIIFAIGHIALKDVEIIMKKNSAIVITGFIGLLGAVLTGTGEFSRLFACPT